MPDQNALYPIREISRLTGVTPITLRAWERRYDLIEPVRTESGHRLYTQEHVDFINQAVALTKQGIPISKAKSVIEEQVQAHKDTLLFADIDFEEEIVQACHQCNFEEVQGLLERMCITMFDQQLRQIMVNVSLKLAKSDMAVRTLWYSVVTPLLFGRTYQGRKLFQSQRKKNIYIICANHYHPALEQLVAHQAILSGYNPIIGWENHPEALLETLQKLRCEAMVVVDTGNQSSTIEGWMQWAKKHQSIELFYVTNAIADIQGQGLLNLKPCSFTDTFE